VPNEENSEGERVGAPIRFDETVAAVDFDMDLLLLEATELGQRHLNADALRDVLTGECRQLKWDLPSLGAASQDQLVRRHLQAVKGAADDLRSLRILVRPPEGYEDVSLEQERLLLARLTGAIRVLQTDMRAGGARS
jgi:hypothetical protein